MALTHMVVVNHKHQLAGVITRKDLVGENITLKRRRKQKQLGFKFRNVITKKITGEEISY